jgi:hypothetical protein
MTFPAEHSYSAKYPPVNRTPTGLGTVEIHIKHATGFKRFDPNSSVLAAHSGPAKLELGDPCTMSFISGEPGYLYRNDKVELALTAEEICRLVMGSLRPEEFLAIAEKVGVFYEIAGSRYNEGTGIALDPRYTYAEQEEHTTRANRPQLFILDNNKGKPRPHSIMAFDAARDLRLAFASQTDRRAYVLDLIPPNANAKLDPFNNVVVLRMYVSGAMEAYGPFDTTDDAQEYQPTTAMGYATEVIVGMANSAYVG